MAPRRRLEGVRRLQQPLVAVLKAAAKTVVEVCAGEAENRDDFCGDEEGGEDDGAVEEEGEEGGWLAHLLLLLLLLLLVESLLLGRVGVDCGALLLLLLCTFFNIAVGRGRRSLRLLLLGGTAGGILTLKLRWASRCLRGCCRGKRR